MSLSFPGLGLPSPPTDLLMLFPDSVHVCLSGCPPLRSLPGPDQLLPPADTLLKEIGVDTKHSLHLLSRKVVRPYHNTVNYTQVPWLVTQLEVVKVIAQITTHQGLGVDAGG